MTLFKTGFLAAVALSCALVSPRALASIEIFYGPRITGREVHFLVVAPLVFSAIFGLLELGRYANTGEYRWQMPAFPLGITFGLVLPFTLDFDSQLILIK